MPVKFVGTSPYTTGKPAVDCNEGLTEDNEFDGQPDGRAAGRQLVTAVHTGVLQSHATDGQPTQSTRPVTDDIMPRLELPANIQAGVDDQR